MANKMHFFYADEDGDTSKSTWYTEVTNVSALSTLLTLLRGVTNAAVPRVALELQVEVDNPQAATAGPYDIADKGVLPFLDSLGNLYLFTFPCPDAVIFSDSDHMDEANAQVIAARAAIQACVRTVSGESLVGTGGQGYRIRSNRQST